MTNQVTKEERKHPKFKLLNFLYKALERGRCWILTNIENGEKMDKLAC